MQRQREKLSKKLLKNWYCNKDIGKIKEKYYSWLQKKYGFDEWHVSPINYRPYAIEIVNYLNKQIKNNVVEIGCGLGEIIGNVYDCNRSGYDIDSNVICAARKLYHNTEFRVGTFENVAKQDIDYLVTVNFIHGISPAELKEQYTRICGYNRVAHIILDIIVGGGDKGYKYNHDIEFLFDSLGYKVEKKLHSYPVLNGRRWIYVMKRR